MYPTKLSKIINLFESLPEDERRETLVSYADNAKRQEPRDREKFDLIDVRKDEECTDTVGVYLQVDENGKAHIRMTLGPEVQTLTRSMTAILCKGLEGATPHEILDMPSDFVTRIVGSELVRLRSQTVYYVLTRITVLGALYLAVICLLPEWLISYAALPFYFGGTSLLIVVNVTMDTVAQIHGHLQAHQYEGLIIKARLKGRKR